jgi:hypothetical protein
MSLPRTAKAEPLGKALVGAQRDAVMIDLAPGTERRDPVMRNGRGSRLRGAVANQRRDRQVRDDRERFATWS